MRIKINCIEYSYESHQNVINQLGGINSIKKRSQQTKLFGEQYYLLNILKVDAAFNEKFNMQFNAL